MPGRLTERRAAQARADERRTVAGDIYSLAATLYALLSGRPPRFPADARSPGLATILSLHDQPVEDVPGAPPELMAVLRQGLAPDPGMRPRSAAALRDALAGRLPWPSRPPAAAAPVPGSRPPGQPPAPAAPADTAPPARPPAGTGAAPPGGPPPSPGWTPLGAGLPPQAGPRPVWPPTVLPAGNLRPAQCAADGGRGGRPRWRLASW